MTSKERVKNSFNHKPTDKIAIDFGATAVTGIHVLAIERLRAHYGLEKRLVKVIEPYQMLGEIDSDLMEVMGVDVIGLKPYNTMFGYSNQNWKEFTTFWGQKVLVSDKFITKINAAGDLIIYPEGDSSVPPSGKMPKSSFFFDSIIRQGTVDDSKLNPEDNLEEFTPLSDEELKFWKTQFDSVKGSDKGIIINFGGTALGDIALVPAPFMKHPKGIRDITEWYMSTVMRPDYVHTVFEKQTDVVLKNLSKMFSIVGNQIEAIFICGTDFGTQDSQFCSAETFRELYLPYYKKMNDWIHKNTSWKTFKHSCGSVVPLVPSFIEAGFDILNPVQINATGMDSKLLKSKFGDQITFWGGGVDTQKVLSFGTPHDVEKQVMEQCDILGKNGGFIFNTVHNVQATVPVENLAAMIEALRKFNGK